jgi:hypothetical protein
MGLLASGGALFAALATFSAGPARGGADRFEIVHPGALHDVHLSPPAIAAAPDGAVFVAWARQDAQGRHVLVREVTRAGAPVVVDPAGLAVDGIHQAPGLAAGPGGELYLSWSSSKPKPPGVHFASDLRLSRSLDGGRSFEAPLRVNEDRPISHSFEGLAVSPDGTVHLAWIDSRAGWEQAGTFAARIVERGSRVAEIVALAGDTCVCCRVALAAGPGGRVAALWRQNFPGQVRDMVLARSADGGLRFDTPQRVANDGWVMPACPHRGGSLALDAQGRSYLAWYTEGEDAKPSLRLAVAEAGAPAGPPRSLPADAGALQDQPAIAVGADGAGLVVWESFTAVRRQVVAGELAEAGRALGAPQALSSAMKAFSPAVAAAPGGGFWVAWHEEAFPSLKTVVQRRRPAPADGFTRAARLP